MKKLNLDSKVFIPGEALSRTQLKKIMGGEGSGGDPEIGGCWSSIMPCEFEEKPGEKVYGTCETNSLNKCVCNAKSSSVVLGACTKQ